MTRELILPQNSIQFGEISPDAIGREDIAAYGAAVKELENFNLLLEGGIERRWGSEHIAELVGDSRAFSFEFNEDQQYVMLFSNLRLDVYSLDDSNPDILPITTFVETVTSGATWTAAMLRTLHVAHSGDTMFVADAAGGIQMLQIKRVSATSFTISNFDFEENDLTTKKFQPYLKFADPGITLTPSATTGTITLTTSAAYWDAIGNTHDGIIVRLVDTPGDSPKECAITTISSTTVANATVRETLDGVLATTDWDEQVFSAANGWQMEVKFGENRLIVSGCRDFPHGNWLSNTSAFFRFEDGTGADNQMIERPINSGKIETVRGVNVTDNIEIYTDQGEHYIPLNKTTPLSPGSAAIRAQSTYGMNKKVPPMTYDGATIFVQRTGMAIREFLYDDLNNKYNALPLSLLATHMLRNKTNNLEVPADIQSSGVIDSTLRRPESYYFTVNAGIGEMVGFHSIRSEKVAGFFRWSTAGKFWDVCVVGDQVYVLVKRDVPGDVWDAAFSDDFGREETLYHLERMEADFTLDHARRAVRPNPGKVFAGFSHLAGRTVNVVSRNAINHGSFTVASDGTITIDEDDVEIVAGLDYTVRLVTLRPRFTAAGYAITGEIKRLVSIVIQMNNVFSLTAGGNTLLIRKVTDDMSLDPSAIAGQREFSLRGYSRGANVTLTQADPLPLRILAFQLKIGVA